MLAGPRRYLFSSGQYSLVYSRLITLNFIALFSFTFPKNLWHNTNSSFSASLWRRIFVEKRACEDIFNLPIPFQVKLVYPGTFVEAKRGLPKAYGRTWQLSSLPNDYWFDWRINYYSCSYVISEITKYWIMTEKTWNWSRKGLYKVFGQVNSYKKNEKIQGTVETIAQLIPHNGPHAG